MTDTVLHTRDTVTNKRPGPSTLKGKWKPRDVLVKQVPISQNVKKRLFAMQKNFASAAHLSQASIPAQVFGFPDLSDTISSQSWYSLSHPF